MAVWYPRGPAVLQSFKGSYVRFRTILQFRKNFGTSATVKAFFRCELSAGWCMNKTISEMRHGDGLPSPPTLAELKRKQSAKIRELAFALARVGMVGLDQKAAVLGLRRSTAWSLLKANYKGSGLSAGLIKRMLASPDLPKGARAVLLDYIAEKSMGAYGHSIRRLRLFRQQFASELLYATPHLVPNCAEPAFKVNDRASGGHAHHLADVRTD
jgi:hypothetical protein